MKLFPDLILVCAPGGVHNVAVVWLWKSQINAAGDVDVSDNPTKIACVIIGRI